MFADASDNCVSTFWHENCDDYRGCFAGVENGVDSDEFTASRLVEFDGMTGILRRVCADS